MKKDGISQECGPSGDSGDSLGDSSGFLAAFARNSVTFARFPSETPRFYRLILIKPLKRAKRHFHALLRTFSTFFNFRHFCPKARPRLREACKNNPGIRHFRGCHLSGPLSSVFPADFMGIPSLPRSSFGPAFPSLLCTFLTFAGLSSRASSRSGLPGSGFLRKRDKGVRK